MSICFQTHLNIHILSEVWSATKLKTLETTVVSCLYLFLLISPFLLQNGPDWFCIIVGFKNGSVGFYTDTGHLLLLEKLDDCPVMKISCHTGTYGTLPDDIHILFSTCECIITGSSLYQTLRNAKAQLARGIMYNCSMYMINTLISGFKNIQYL